MPILDRNEWETVRGRLLGFVWEHTENTLWLMFFVSNKFHHGFFPCEYWFSFRSFCCVLKLLEMQQLFFLTILIALVSANSGYVCSLSSLIWTDSFKGPEKVKQLSGYITVPGPLNDNGTHLFYWFFESVSTDQFSFFLTLLRSRVSPSTTPFIIWLTGIVSFVHFIWEFVRGSWLFLDGRTLLCKLPFSLNFKKLIFFFKGEWTLHH